MTGKRWRSGGTGEADLVLEAFDPPMPGAGELLVQVDHAALNFSDLLMLVGRYQVRPPPPFTPGQEVSGAVVATGPDTAFATGTRIAAKVDWGGFATHAIVPESHAIPIAPDVPGSIAAALPISYTTAYVALGPIGALKTGETCLVHAAAGAAGLAACQVARARGARVIGTASTADKRAVALANGAVAALAIEAGWTDRLKTLAPEGVDCVFDTIGGEVTLQSLDLLRRDGRLLIVGFAGAPPAKLPTHKLLLKRAAALGVYWNHAHDAAMIDRITSQMVRDLASGAIAPLVDVRLGLSALPTALADLKSRRTSGKVCLDVASNA